MPPLTDAAIPSGTDRQVAKLPATLQAAEQAAVAWFEKTYGPVRDASDPKVYCERLGLLVHFVRDLYGEAGTPVARTDGHR